MKKFIALAVLVSGFLGLSASAYHEVGHIPSVVPLWAVEAENKLNRERDVVINNWLNSYRQGVKLPVPDDFRVQQFVEYFLKSDEAKLYNVVSASADMVYRNWSDDFFLNSRHIELPEFKALGINADFVARGATVRLQDAR